MATSGSHSWTVAVQTFEQTKYYLYARFNWERVSVSHVNNTSTINWTFSYTASPKPENSSNPPSWGLTGCPLKIDGVDYSRPSSDGIITVDPGQTVVVGTGTSVIQHLEDGSKTFLVETTYLYSGYFPVNTNFALDSIPRPARVTSAPNFTDEDNPTIYYSNPGGSAVKSLQACIATTGYWADVIWFREISKTGSSYTFRLSDSERSVLRGLLSQGSYISVRFYVKTVFDNGETIYHYAPATLTFVGYMPTLSPTVEDINSDTLRLTGDKNTLVRYMSTAYYKVNGSGNKGGTIASQEVRNGDTYTEPEGIIENVYSNTFYFSVTDDRGYTTNKAVVFNNLAALKWIEYIKLTCSFETEPVSANGDLVVHVSGKYFGGSFGAASNKLTLEYAVKSVEDESGEEAPWIYVNSNNGIIEPSLDDDNYTYTFTIPGLDYNDAYKLKLRASDELMSNSTIERVVMSANTIFDWSKTDFNFNVPVQMNKGFMYPQTILWRGVAQMDEGETIELSAPISTMPTGIVLIFSLFRDGAEVDASVHSFFVPRVAVQYLMGSSARHNFIMGINSNFGTFGAKYLTIEDDRIMGFEGNNNSGTGASGITFNNSSFVLRYVIGV